jgi:hypothetical protein
MLPFNRGSSRDRLENIQEAEQRRVFQLQKLAQQRQLVFDHPDPMWSVCSILTSLHTMLLANC